MYLRGNSIGTDDDDDDDDDDDGHTLNHQFFAGIWHFSVPNYPRVYTLFRPFHIRHLTFSTFTLPHG